MKARALRIAVDVFVFGAAAIRGEGEGVKIIKPDKKVAAASLYYTHTCYNYLC